MTPDLAHVVTALQIGGGLLGAASAGGLLFSIVAAVQLWGTSAPARSALTANPDAILLLLEGMTRVFSALGGVAGFVGKLLVVVLAIVSLFGLIGAAVLFFTARGLAEQQQWARGVAAALACGVLVWSLVAFAALPWPMRVAAIACTLAAAYALVALWRGYSV